MRRGFPVPFAVQNTIADYARQNYYTLTPSP